ncbi:MAG: dihydrodipicolinate synthase family protein [Lautropia sp.]
MGGCSRSEARARLRRRFRGYFAVLYTPIDASGEIDEPGLRHNVEHVLGLPGVGGLSVNSIHQEFWTLTLDERMRVAEIVLETTGARVPIVVGVSDPATRNVIRLARHAERAGADAVMVWPPYYGPRAPEGVDRFYREVGDAIDIGFLAYSTTLAELGHYLTPEALAELLDIEHLCGVQDTSQSFANFANMVERVGHTIAVSTSLEETFLFGRQVFGPDRMPDFLIGSSRPLLVQSAAQPRCGRYLDAVLASDYAGAAQAMREIVRIAQRLQGRYFSRGSHHVALTKTLAGYLGMKTGGFRPPLSPPSPQELDECLQVLVDAGLLAGHPASGAGV